MMEKLHQLKALTLLFCMQNCLCINADWKKLKPTLEAFINKLKHISEVDKHVHPIERTYEKFIKKWTLYNCLVT